MGQSYHICAICEEIFGDYSDWGVCSDCEGFLCGYCRNEMIDKYGVLASGDPKIESGYWSEGELKHCDACDKIDVKEVEKNILDVVKMFMEKHNITHEEQIHQTDNIILDAYHFIEDLFIVSKPLLNLEREEK